jgi:hypothetical protein
MARIRCVVTGTGSPDGSTLSFSTPPGGCPSQSSQSRLLTGVGSATWPVDQSLRPSRVTNADICQPPPGTLASGRACIGRLSSSFLAPQTLQTRWFARTLQTRWFATSGTGSRFGNPSDSGSIRGAGVVCSRAFDFKEFSIAGEIGESYWAM